MRKTIGALALLGVFGAWPVLAADAPKGSLSEKEALLNKLHQVDKMEIEMGNWMKDHGSTQAVKDYAKQLVTDHQDADKLFTNYAKSQDIALKEQMPPAEMKKMDALKSEKGAAMDRMYLTDMVNGHDKVIEKVKAARGRFDARLDSLLDELMPKLQAHRDDAAKLMGPRSSARRLPTR